MLRLIKPKYFMPIHGEYRMQRMHMKLANDCGIPEENCFIMDNGDVLALRSDEASVAGKIPSGSSILTEMVLEISVISYYAIVVSFLKKDLLL